MGNHCVYCKETGHYRIECTKAPTVKRRCYQCGNTNHIARNCFRINTDDSTSNKRRRGKRIDPKHFPMKPSQLIVTTAVEVVLQKEPSVTSTVETTSETSVTVIEDIPQVETDTVVPSVPVDILEPASDPILSRSTRSTVRRPAHLEEFIVPSRQTKTCKCGSTSHRKTNHSQCPLNKKNLNMNRQWRSPGTRIKLRMMI
ncbi:hypothetical protein A0J61_10170 [Choanephora cucurbitarum]|uniref:CCHC-type domain-containing protein n=1 Tax=Choanephora cucurbitarum TaxID=101091 RepID=A0A1C7MY89_9FUNG|nr:hypothetical protein A0J61_10170 [Choanephora cucurbitarum]